MNGSESFTACTVGDEGIDEGGVEDEEPDCGGEGHSRSITDAAVDVESVLWIVVSIKCARLGQRSHNRAIHSPSNFGAK
jgi:hypothetical protein